MFCLISLNWFKPPCCLVLFGNYLKFVLFAIISYFQLEFVLAWGGGGRVFWQTRIPVHFFLHSRIPGIYFCQSQITENTENTLLLGFSDEIFSIPGFSEQKWENPGPRNDYIFPDSRKKLHQFSDSRNKNDQSRNPEAPPPTIEEQKAFWKLPP